MSKPSLRQRKKDRTRATLVRVSQRLFAEQGYDATTLEQICEAAEVSVPTLLVYFESKERLALAPDHDAFGAFHEKLTDPERRDDTITLWRAHVATMAAIPSENPRASLKYYRLISSSPVLVKANLALLQQYEDLIAVGLARDFGTDPGADVATSLLATTLTFGSRSAVRRWIAGGGKGDLAAAALAIVDFVVERFPRPGEDAASDTGSRSRRAARAAH